MAYYTATNTGKGFITHEDNESAHVAGYPGDVWGTTNTAWATRVGAVSKTKSQAQTIVTDIIEAQQATWDALSDEDKAASHGRPTTITLP